MKSTIAALLFACGCVFATPEADYIVDNSLGDAASSHNLSNIGSNGISVAVKMDAQKLKTNDRIAIPLFSVGNSSDSLAVGMMYDSSYAEIDAGFLNGDSLSFSTPYALIYLDDAYNNAAHVTLMFAYRKDGSTAQKQVGTDAEGNPIYETVVESDSAVLYFSVWDDRGNLMTDVYCGIGGREGLKNRIDSFTLFNIDPDYITYAEVYDEEVTNEEGVAIFNRMINGEEESAPSDGATGTVPEPTTATLSLLALAGLAARRRRK